MVRTTLIIKSLTFLLQQLNDNYHLKMPIFLQSMQKLYSYAVLLIMCIMVVGGQNTLGDTKLFARKIYLHPCETNKAHHFGTSILMPTLVHIKFLFKIWKRLKTKSKPFAD